VSTATSRAAKQRASAAKFQHRTIAYALVTERWERAGRKCEGCGAVVDLIERHHTFARGHLLADRWASRAEMLAALCCARSYGMQRSGCHEAVTLETDPELRDRLRLFALVRLCVAEHVPMGLLADRDVLGAAREVEDWLTARDRLA
jgi:hypothetical protein